MFEKVIIIKLLIVDSRSITDFDLGKYVNHEVDTIISGGANGIDHLAEIYADEHKITKYIIRPQYHKYRRAAPLKRNELKLMVDLADEVLVIWDGVSRGSQYTIEYARKKENPSWLYMKRLREFITHRAFCQMKKRGIK